MKKDKQDEAQRHAHRDAIIRAVFQQLVYHENYSYECAYIFIGDIWGLGRSKLAQIVNAKDDCPLSGYCFFPNNRCSISEKNWTEVIFLPITA